VNWQYVNSMTSTDEEHHLINQYDSGIVPQAQVDTICRFDNTTSHTTSTLLNMLCRFGARSATARLISFCNGRRTQNTGGVSTMAVSGRHSSSNSSIYGSSTASTTEGTRPEPGFILIGHSNENLCIS
jgi:hypothetical protein